MNGEQKAYTVRRFGNSRGVALVMALIVTLVVFLMVGGIWYVITQSTTMTGAGKRYATAEEAADGSVNIIKDSIDLSLNGQSPASVFPNSGDCDEGGTMLNAIMTDGVKCSTTVNLAGLTGLYQAKVSITRLYSRRLGGTDLEFPPRSGGAGQRSTAIFYRIITTVTGPNNSTAENAVLYRFVG